MNSRFDAQEFANRLKNAGVLAAQAEVHREALAGAMSNVVGTVELKELERRLLDEIQLGEKRTRVEFLEVRAEMKDLRAELKDLKTDNKVTRWMTATILAVNVAMLGRMLFPG